jgi:hypothetical protein
MALTRRTAAEVTRLRHEASFVFDGTVEREAASSLSIIAPGPGTVVVRVGRIYHAPGDLHDQAGQEVTVVFADTPAPAANGQQIVFFVEPFSYGETIGAQAVGTVALPDDLDSLEETVGAATSEIQDQELRRHLAEADAVVHGVVLERHPVDDPSPRSEHSPDWWVATIAITSLFKGNIEGELLVRFPNSTDLHWYWTPKPQEGEEAIFVLHRDGLALGGADLAILHDRDVIPAEPEALERHSRLA